MEIKSKGKNNIYAFILCALFAALTAVGAMIQIPLPFTPLPVSLATLSVMLAAGLLGPRYGSLAISVYILIGAIGIPVFSNFSGGVGIIAGPTGGYIIGYIAMTFVSGLLIHKKSTKETGVSRIGVILALALGNIVLYTIGTAWFIFQTNTQLIPALTMCVIPFLPGDLLKILASSLLIQKLKKYLTFI